MLGSFSNERDSSSGDWLDSLIYSKCILNLMIFTESVTRPIHSISRNVCLSVCCLSVPSGNLFNVVEWILLIKEHSPETVKLRSPPKSGIVD